MREAQLPLFPLYFGSIRAPGSVLVTLAVFNGGSLQAYNTRIRERNGEDRTAVGARICNRASIAG